MTFWTGTRFFMVFLALSTGPLVLGAAQVAMVDMQMNQGVLERRQDTATASGAVQEPDEVRLENGQVLRGRIVGITTNQLTLRQGDKVLTLDKIDVVSLTYDTDLNKFWNAAIDEENRGARRRLLERSARFHPNDARAHLWLARMAWAEGRIDEGDAWLKGRRPTNADGTLLAVYRDLCRGRDLDVIRAAERTDAKTWLPVQVETMRLFRSFALARTGRTVDAALEYAGLPPERGARMDFVFRQWDFEGRFRDYRKTLPLLAWAGMLPEERRLAQKSATNLIRFLRPCPTPREGWIEDRLVGLPGEPFFDPIRVSWNAARPKDSFEAALLVLRRQGGAAALEQIARADYGGFRASDRASLDLLRHLAKADAGDFDGAELEWAVLEKNPARRAAWRSAWTNLGLAGTLDQYGDLLTDWLKVQTAPGEAPFRHENMANLRRFWNSNAVEPERGWIESRDLRRVGATRLPVEARVKLNLALGGLGLAGAGFLAGTLLKSAYGAAMPAYLGSADSDLATRMGSQIMDQVKAADFAFSATESALMLGGAFGLWGVADALIPRPSRRTNAAPKTADPRGVVIHPVLTPASLQMSAQF